MVIWLLRTIKVYITSPITQNTTQNHTLLHTFILKTCAVRSYRAPYEYEK
jgi:hypothetical protein